MIIEEKGNVLMIEIEKVSPPFLLQSPSPPFGLICFSKTESVYTALALLKLRVRARGLRLRDPLVSSSPC